MFVSNVLYCIISSNKSWDRKKRPETFDNLINNISFQISFYFLGWRERITEADPENSERGGQDSDMVRGHMVN